MRHNGSRFLPTEWIPETIERTPDLAGEPARVPDDVEFATLHDYRARLRDALAADIHLQNQDGFPIAANVRRPLLRILGIPEDHPFSAALGIMLEWAYRDGTAAVMQQKLLFNRARPYQIDPTISPLFTPEHPSYPSGHSTQSHVVALAIVEVLKSANDPKGKLAGAAVTVLARAHEFAVNREIAGVHYPSDTEAGIRLSRLIIAEYMKRDDFIKQCFEPAIGELNKLL